MTINRVTNRGQRIDHDQITTRRADHHAGITYLIEWQLLQRTDKGYRLCNRTSKPFGDRQAAEYYYTRHTKRGAVLVELYRYDDDKITCLRRFCNLSRLRLVTAETDRVFSTHNPDYEFPTEAEVTP